MLRVTVLVVLYELGIQVKRIMARDRRCPNEDM